MSFEFWLAIDLFHFALEAFIIFWIIRGQPNAKLYAGKDEQSNQ